MESIEIKIYITRGMDALLPVVLNTTHIPFGGLVYAGIQKFIVENDNLGEYTDGNSNISEDSYIEHTCVLSKFTYEQIFAKYGIDSTVVLTTATCNIIGIGFVYPDIIKKWYNYSLPSYGSGKISKTR